MEDVYLVLGGPLDGKYRTESGDTFVCCIDDDNHQYKKVQIYADVFVYLDTGTDIKFALNILFKAYHHLVQELHGRGIMFPKQ